MRMSNARFWQRNPHTPLQLPRLPGGAFGVKELSDKTGV